MRKQKIVVSITVLCALAAFSSGCKGGSARDKISELIAPPPLVCEWNTESRDKKETVNVYFSAANDLIYSGPADQVYCVWDDGMLVKGSNGAEWQNLNRETGKYEPVEIPKITNWETPVSVDPVNSILYVMAHTVAPLRRLDAMYLDGRDAEQKGALTADDIEIPSPIPTNGWAYFYVDRPSEAKAVTIEKNAIRKLRCYGNGSLGGEFDDAENVFTLKNGIVLKRESGWILEEIAENSAFPIKGRTLSFGQIEGEIRPLVLIGDILLIAVDRMDSSGEKTIGCDLYEYGMYTRTPEKIWTVELDKKPATIIAADAESKGDYVLVASVLDKPSSAVIGSLKDAAWTSYVNLTLNGKMTRANIFLLSEKISPPETTESTQGSTQDSETEVNTTESVDGKIEQDISPDETK
ncbi:MAG: hypothetical protein ABIC40_02305 [bacterium]